MSSSTSTAINGNGSPGHARKVSSSIHSISSNSKGATASSEASSATRAGLLTRQTSVARKRTSLAGNSPGGTRTSTAISPGRDTSNHAASPSSSASSRRAGSISMSRSNTSMSSSGSSSMAMDAAKDSEARADEPPDATTPEELSRLTREQLVALVVRERQYKDEIESRLVDTSTLLATVSETNDGLVKDQALHTTKLEEAYASANRLEHELAEQMESVANTKDALREAEKGIRDAQKRFRDQMELFESEQAKWNDIEQSLQGQITKLRSDHEALLLQQIIRSPSTATTHITEASEDFLRQSTSHNLVLSPTPSTHHFPAASPTFQIPESTLEELQFLHARLSELSSEHEELQAEVIRLSNELEEAQRMNGDLQEQNENYEVLVSEKMLAGLGNFIDSGIGSSVNTSSLLDGASSSDSRPSSIHPHRSRQEGEDDDPAGMLSDDDDDNGPEVYESSGKGDLSTGAVAVQMTPERVKRSAAKKNRQSMTGLEASGGFDLEAELDRARQEEEEEARRKEERKSIESAARRKANQSTLTVVEGEPLPKDVETLRKEVKLLRQENKGLSTYVSKILERIIGIEGFEKVLSVEKDPKPAASPRKSEVSAATMTTAPSASSPPPLPARTGSILTSAFSSRPAPVRIPSGPSLSTLAPAPSAAAATAAPAVVEQTHTAISAAENKKKNRFSVDWLSSSLFKGSSTTAAIAAQSASSTSAPALGSGTSAPAPGLKPMRLTGGPASKVPTTEEDEDDRRARARLQSEMRLLGIDAPRSPGLQGGSPGRVRISSNRSSDQRVPSGASPTPPALPPKQTESTPDQGSDSEERSSANDRTSASSQASHASTANSSSEGVKIRGHRKRPSASFAPSNGGELNSVGLGLTYSKDSASIRSAGSPGLRGETELPEVENEVNRTSVIASPVA